MVTNKETLWFHSDTLLFFYVFSPQESPVTHERKHTELCMIRILTSSLVGKDICYLLTDFCAYSVGYCTQQGEHTQWPMSYWSKEL